MADRLVIDGVENGGYPYNENARAITETSTPPIHPPDWWLRIDGTTNYGRPYSKDNKNFKRVGGFCEAENLIGVSVPSTVTEIGDYAFSETQLCKVKIPCTCSCADTSFPADCVVTTY